MKKSELKQIIKESIQEMIPSKTDENLLSSITQSLKAYLKYDPRNTYSKKSRYIVLYMNEQGMADLNTVLHIIINELKLKIRRISANDAMCTFSVEK